jgi:hypothetical protein
VDKKSRNLIRISGALMVGVALLAIGAYAGYNTGLKSGIQEEFFCSALHTGTYVSVLRGLKNAEIEPAARLLEVSVNAGVILMTPEQDVLEERTAKAVHDALLKVKSYRDEYPWSGAKQDVDARVTKALANVANPNK